MARGNKSNHKTKINNINLSKVVYLAENGYNDKQLAAIFGVTEQTINNWKKAYPVWFESLKKGKLLADAKVEASLFQRATGYSHPEVHVSNYEGSITLTPIVKHYPPDPTSMIFWLKNRKKEEWRDRVDHEVAGKDGKPIQMEFHVMSKEAQERLSILRKKISGK